MPDRDSGPGAITPNRELVVFALSLLGGDTRRVHTEELAIKCFELFPDSFSWTRYPQYPDKDIVRVALTDARKEQHGQLVDGRSGQRRGLTAKTRRAPATDGWLLTPSGVEFMRENANRFAAFADGGEVKEHRQRSLRQIARIRNHRLYQQYGDEGDAFSPSIGAVADLLRCRVDAAPAVWEARFEGARRLAAGTDDPAMSQFVARCVTAYLEQK